MKDSSSSSSSSNTSSSIEEQLLAILKSVGLELNSNETDSKSKTEVDDNNKLNLSFAGLGGDSLSAVRFASAVKQHFDVDLPISIILSEGFHLQELISKLKARRAGEKLTITAPSSSSSSSHSLDVSLEDDIVAPPDQPRFVLNPSYTIHNSNLAYRAPIGHPPSCVLLTGVTGFVGIHIFVELLKNLPRKTKIYCLVRAKDEQEAMHRILKTIDFFSVDTYNGALLEG